MVRIIQTALCALFLAAQVVCAPLCATAQSRAPDHSCCGSAENSKSKASASHSEQGNCAGCAKALHSEKAQLEVNASQWRLDTLSLLTSPLNIVIPVNNGRIVALDNLNSEKSPPISFLRIAAQAAAHAPPVA